MRKQLFALALLAGTPGLALACTNMDLGASPYNVLPQVQGVGWGSALGERQNAVAAAVGAYNTAPGPNLDFGAEICITFDDDSTEEWRNGSMMSPTPVPEPGTHAPPASAGGGGAPGWYGYNGSSWAYSTFGCSYCIYWGEIVDVIPDEREEP